MKRNKFRALITLDGAGTGSDHADPIGQGRTLIVRACHRQTHCGKVFSAFVTPDDEVPWRAEGPHVLVNMLVADDEVADYLGAGDHFDLWLGSTIGHGVVSRRVVPCW